MAIYAIDLTYTDPTTCENHHRLYNKPTDFLRRFERLERRRDEALAFTERQALEPEQKKKQTEAILAEYAEGLANEPTQDAKYVSCAVTTGRTHSWRRYGSIKELEDSLIKNRDDMEQKTWMDDPSRKNTGKTIIHQWNE